MSTVTRVIKKDPVLVISALLAVVSAIWVPPDSGYAAYIDVRVLTLLFCLMAVVGSIKEQGVFERVSASLLRRVASQRALAVLLICLPFFSSMLVTNDVALITFVPLAMAALSTSPPALLIVVVLQTIAANLGSALTPMGNPQNLFLSTYYAVSIGDFLRLTVPLVGIGLLLIIGFTLLRIKQTPLPPLPSVAKAEPLSIPRLIVSAGLFALCVASVLHLIHYGIVFLIVCVLLLMTDRRSFCHVDIRLLLTFVFLFIFVGNIARIDTIRTVLAACIDGRALPVSALASQVISNVPAAILLSGFTKDGADLILGTNIGGLGTPIASMASLISLRLYSQHNGANIKRYLLVFMIYNVVLLVLLLVGAMAAAN